jgi:Trk K+ transport system NAD-binding subunit
MMDNTELHVLFGAGQVGYPLAARLLAAGKRVRIAKRSSAHVPAGCEIALGDASDQAFLCWADPAGGRSMKTHR